MKITKSQTKATAAFHMKAAYYHELYGQKENAKAAKNAANKLTKSFSK